MKTLLRKINAVLNYEILDGEKTVPPPLAAGIIILFTTGLLYLGNYLGNAFFWNHSDGFTRLERDFHKVVEEVREDPGSATARLKLGWVYYQQGDLAAAEKHYQEALLIDPNSFGAHLNLGILYFDRKNYSQAIRYLKKAAELRPKYETPYFYLGVSFFRLQKYEEALRYLLVAIRLEPASADNHYYFALTKEKLGNIKEAKEHLEIALTFDPQYREAQAALARLEGKGKGMTDEN